MGRVVLLLIGFVLVAVGVMLRRVYGVNQAKAISELQQKREALVSEQLKIQDAIRLASDRQHIQAIAQSRLNMRIPAPNQIIYLERRPVGAPKDTIRP